MREVYSCSEFKSQLRSDPGRDDMCLNLGGNFTAAMFACNRGCGAVGCGVQYSRVFDLDFVAKRRSMTIGKGGKARRRRTALFGPRLDHHAGEPCFLQLATDQCRIVVAM